MPGILSAWAGAADWTLQRPSGDVTGVTDTAVLNATLAAAAPGTVVQLARGIYYVNAPLVISTPNVVLQGDGLGNTNRQGSTVITPVSGFAGTAVITITTAASGSQVQNLCVIGPTTTTTSNPACNGLEVTGCKFVNLVDLFFQYLNGWCVEAVGNATQGCIGLSALNLTGYNSAGGFHGQGVTGSNFAGQYSLIDMQFSQIGVATGPAANLDCLYFQDINDILTLNTNCAVSSASTGSTLHIGGACSTHLHTNIDIGVFPVAGTQNSVITISDTGNGSPSQLAFQGGVLQAGLVGLTITGGANQLQFIDLWFKNNQTHNVTDAGTGYAHDFRGCTWSLGGQGASGTNYDLNVTGTPTASSVRDCRFNSPVVSSGTAGVQGVVNIGTSGQDIIFQDNAFSGTGTSVGNSFPVNLPVIARNCHNYNPHGAITVTVPGTGVATTALHYDSMFYITAGASTCTIVRNTNGYGGGAGPSVTIPAGAFAPVFVPANTNITPTYTNAPTWVVDGI
jgi:hypothetical protein